MAAKELTLTFGPDHKLTAKVEKKNGEDRLVIGWRDANGTPRAQALWLSVKEAPSILRTLAGFADLLQKAESSVGKS